MKTKTLASIYDMIDATKSIKGDKYKVIQGGVVIHETDDMEDAQRLAHAHHGVIAGKLFTLFLKIVEILR